MDFVLFWGLIVFVLILLPTLLIFLSYWIPKKMGYRKTGVIISRTLIFVAVLGILAIVFNDQLFFKSDVNKILSRHNIKLKNDFKIVQNSSSGFMDYSQTFILTISQQDKEEIIKIIKESENFAVDLEDDFYLPSKTDRYSDTKVYADYENDKYYKRETYQTFEKGTAPVHEIISIEKRSNKLKFEQIVD